MQFDFPEVTAELMKIADAARRDFGGDRTGSPGENRRAIGRVER